MIFSHSFGRVFKAEGTIIGKALKWEGTWPVLLEQRKQDEGQWEVGAELGVLDSPVMVKPHISSDKEAVN